MWWKTSKDRLIEWFQAELKRERESAREEIKRSELDLAQVRHERNMYGDRLDEQAEIAREAVALASMAVSQLPLDKQNAKISDDPQRPRTMSAYVQRLSELSYKRAAAKGKNLVADMPPPGAQKPHGAS